MSIEEQIYNLVSEANPSNPIDYVHNIVKPLAIKKLNTYITECNDCPISKYNRKTIAYGNPNAPILIIGDSVAEDQIDQINNPLECEYGKLIKETLLDLGVNKDDLYYLNAVNCFTCRDNGEKRAPTSLEKRNCSIFLEYAIRTVEPLMIITLGGVALNSINEEIGRVGVEEQRGNWFLFKGIPVMPTYHPDYFNKMKKWADDETIQMYIDTFKQDVKTAIDWLDSYYPNLLTSSINGGEIV